MKDFYEISSERFSFGATVLSPEKVMQDDPDEEQLYYIEFGGTEACVGITVTENIEKAFITGTKHNPACALNLPLPEGDLGTVIMLSIAMNFTKVIFPYVSHFILTDTSRIKCEKRTRVSLSSYYLAKYGTTWYMKKFSAVPENYEDFDDAMRKTNAYLSSKTKKKEFTFFQFYEEHVRDVLLANRFVLDKHQINAVEFLKYLRSKLKPSFERSKTFRTFFLDIDQQSPKNCILFYIWLETFLESIKGGMKSMDNVLWKIDTNEESFQRPDIQVKRVDKSPFVPKARKSYTNIVSMYDRDHRHGHSGGAFFPYGDRNTDLRRI